MSEAVAAAAPATEAAPPAAKQDATFPQDNKPAVAEGAIAATDDASKKVETKDAPTAPVVPDKYDIKAPEGSLLSAAQLEALASYAKEQKLTNEQAQALANREHGAIKSFVENQQQELAKKSEAWKVEASKDAEIGGEAFGKNAELAKRVLAKFGNPTINKFLDDTGYGNHPDVIRVFARLGKAMSEDSLVLPGTQVGGGKKDAVELFYGSQGKSE